jgi:hypothetical protein
LRKIVKSGEPPRCSLSPRLLALESRTPIFHDPTIAQLARYWSTLGKRFGEAQRTTSKPVVAQLIERLAVKYSAM